jgi:hypothetical protein
LRTELCVRFLLRIPFRLIATSQAHLSLVLSLADLPRPSFLVLLLQQLGGSGRCATYLTLFWCGFSSAQEYHLLLVCVCLSSHWSLCKEESLFVFLVFLFFLLLLLHWWGGSVVLVCVCVCLREREREFRVCLFFSVGFVE